jgi:hypothetical protein
LWQYLLRVGIRSECLAWLLMVNRRHLERALRVFADHNSERLQR